MTPLSGEAPGASTGPSADASAAAPAGGATGATGAAGPGGLRPGSRSANRAAKRASTTGVRPKTQVRRSPKRSSSANNTGLVVLAAVAVMVLAAVIIVANPFAAPKPSPSLVAYGNGSCPTSQPAPLATDATKYVTISTGLGDIVIKVSGSLAPIAAGNFVALAQCEYYDGVPFHRTAKLGDGTPFVIQGGDGQNGDGSGGPGYTIKDEPVTTTYKRGTVAMARTSQPNSQGSQFFIVLDDKDGAVLSSTNTYAIFGEVVQGMDVADAIYKASNGVEIPTDPILMDTVTVSDTPPASQAPSSAPSTAPTTAPTTAPSAPSAAPAS
jgi:cyclophilin family peptidyl-prolyl cis-trans isomerase